MRSGRRIRQRPDPGGYDVSRTCFHCGETIAKDVALSACVNGGEQPVCCIGCQAAAEWIGTLGLGDYYRLRNTTAERAVEAADYSAWDRPQLQRLYVRNAADGSAEVCVLVEGLRCAACSWLIDRALRDLPGVRTVEVNPGARRVRIVWARSDIALSEILHRLAQLGYVPHPRNAQALDALDQREARAALKRLVVAGLGMMQAMMYAVTLYAGAFEGIDPATRDFFRWIGLLVTTPVVVYAAQPFFIGAWRELRTRALGMDTTIALAIALIYLASLYETVVGGAQVYFDSASMFVFLLLGGRYLEMRARRRAADVVDALARLQPVLAQRRRADGALETIGVHELEAGDIVIVAEGAAMPADGTLLGMACEVDESLLTGESVPRARYRGEALIAGSVVRSGPVEMRVAHIGADTVLSSIVRLIERAQIQRPHAAVLGDRFAARFVAGVLVLTALTAAAWLYVDPSRAFAASLAVLVVACPCAFALSVPVAYLRAASALARIGVLMPKAEALEKLTRIDRVVFDKTGTLTRDRLELVGVEIAGKRSVNECLRIAAALEYGNAHPFAAAIREAVPGERSILKAEALRTFAGAGIEGRIAGHRYRIGRADFALALSGGTTDDDNVIVLADEHGALAHLRVRETLREEAATAIVALRAQGLAVAMLSGDSDARALAIAVRLNITDFRSRAKPEAKLRALEQWRRLGSVVAMVGDGVNDAPVLAGADVAIALGGGTQLAQSSADLVLASDRLDAIPAARELALTTLRVLRQNLYWAVAYNFASIPLAAFGLVPPWLAAIGMSVSSLFVVLNSLRIAPPHISTEQVSATATVAAEAVPA